MAAIGADAWQEYRGSAAFPARAAALETAPETEPFALRRRAGESLDDAQRRWEVMIRALLEDPDGLHAVLEECVDEDDGLDGIEEGDIDPGHDMSSDEVWNFA